MTHEDVLVFVEELRKRTEEMQRKKRRIYDGSQMMTYKLDIYDDLEQIFRLVDHSRKGRE